MNMLEDMIQKKGLEGLRGLHVIYFEDVYQKEKKGWIGGNESSAYKPVLNDINHIHIQCDDGFNGHRGTSCRLEDIRAILVD